ncbi:hemolysin-III related-domain-containing protein [Xylariaceae sp. FL0662B]|nr:hemolysin-III related-domain-containing protein [Xylariaceae sp. FL0662B]
MASLPPAEGHNDRKWSETPPSSSPPSPLLSSQEKRPPRVDSGSTVTSHVDQEHQEQQHQHHEHQKEEQGDKAAPTPPLLLSYDEIPPCCTRLHNETLNIHTHLVPAGAVYVVAHLRHRYGSSGGSDGDGDGGDGLAPADYAVAAALMLAAASCLGVSAAYHTFLCHSREVEARCLRADFVGIVVLILASFVSGIYAAFWCEARIGSLAAVSVVVVLAPALQGPRWRTLRLLAFVCTGLSGLAPIVHGVVFFGFAQMMRQSGLPYYLAEGGLFLLGAVVYATRFPESLSPGTFDIYGASHQIFHVLVVLATVVHLVGVLDAFDYNYHHRRCV